MLLTIVENGITHGFRNRQEGFFRINVRTYGKEVFISVENSGEAPGESVENSTDAGEKDQIRRGTGTRYIRSRLEELCPGHWSIYRDVRDNMYRVMISYIVE